MDSYVGSLDNPVSLHKYLYANANPVMYTDPSGYFSLSESMTASSVYTTLQSNVAPILSIKKIVSWVNLAVTVYDVSQQVMLLFMGQTTVKGLATAIAKGMVKQAMLNCALKAVLGEAAEMVLKVIGLAQDMDSFVEAVKSGDPERIFVESLRLAVSLFTLKCQCFTGDTLVDTEDGYRRIDEIEAGDYVWAYNSETGECELKEVLSVSVTDTDVIVHVMTSDGEEIRTTMYHPFYVKDEESGKWKAASNLVRGDLLLTENGEKVYVKEVRIEKSVEPVKVYNLEVDELHTYFVAGGVLVHNACNTGSAEGDGSSGTTGNNETSYGKSRGNTFQSSYDIPVDSNGYTKSNLKLGRDVHKEYKQKEVDFITKFKEYSLPSKKRIDFIDFETKTIYELKPYNPSQIKKGIRQLEGYLKEVESLFGSGWTIVLDTY